MAFIIIVSIYSLMILILAFGFARLDDISDPKVTTINSVSVLVAVRDEQHLNDLFADLARIEYPHDKWEVIVVDDHSAATPVIPDLGINIRKIPNQLQGKKAAITTGIAAARGNIIATTDGDCRVGPFWLREINMLFQDPDIKMAVGGVRIEEGRSFFSRLQSLEFVSVAVTGAATLGLGFPTMCNGASLAYRKSAFVEINGFEGNENISSGDDEFLMNKLPRKSVRYLYSKDALITTSPHHLLTSFFHQRLRWAGKWSVNTSLATRIFAVIIFLFHISFIGCALTGFFWPLLAKAFVEAILLIPAANFFRVKWRWMSFIVLQLIYPAYVISVGLLSQVVLPKWKGRAVETKV